METLEIKTTRTLDTGSDVFCLNYKEAIKKAGKLIPPDQEEEIADLHFLNLRSRPIHKHSLGKVYKQTKLFVGYFISKWVTRKGNFKALPADLVKRHSNYKSNGKYYYGIFSA